MSDETQWLRERLEKATRGPWSDIRVGRKGDGSFRSEEVQVCNASGVGVVILIHDGSPEGRANVRTIAALGTLWPHLFTLLEKAIATNDALQAQWQPGDPDLFESYELNREIENCVRTIRALPGFGETTDG